MIFILLITFSIYQALPADWASSRSDDLIFNQIGWLWPTNMLLMGLWAATFRSGTTPGYLLGWVIIASMFGTALAMATKVVNAGLSSWVEIIALRGGMCLYSGWLAAATLLGMSIMLKDLGTFEAGGWDE